MAREYGMQIEVIVPPNHPRAKFTSPASVEVLIQADPAIGAAAHKLCKRVPTHFYTLSPLQRNYHIARKAHTVFAFGKLCADKKRVEGGTGWTVQLAIDQGKEVFLFDTNTNQWYRSENTYNIENSCLKKVTSFKPWALFDYPPFIRAVLWLVRETLLLQQGQQSRTCSREHSVYPKTLSK